MFSIIFFAVSAKKASDSRQKLLRSFIRSALYLSRGTFQWTIIPEKVFKVNFFFGFEQNNFQISSDRFLAGFSKLHCKSPQKHFEECLFDISLSKILGKKLAGLSKLISTKDQFRFQKQIVHWNNKVRTKVLYLLGKKIFSPNFNNGNDERMIFIS